LDAYIKTYKRNARDGHPGDGRRNGFTDVFVLRLNVTAILGGMVVSGEPTGCFGQAAGGSGDRGFFRQPSVEQRGETWMFGLLVSEKGDFVDQGLKSLNDFWSLKGAPLQRSGQNSYAKYSPFPTRPRPSPLKTTDRTGKPVTVHYTWNGTGWSLPGFYEGRPIKKK
jgi:hypothetical protein